MSIEFSEIGEGGIREDGSSEETNVLGDEGDAEDVVEDVVEDVDGDLDISVTIGGKTNKRIRLLEQINLNQDDGDIGRLSLVLEAFARLRCRIV